MNEEMRFKPSSLERKNLSRPWGVMHWDRLPIQPHTRGWKTVTLFFLDTSEAFPSYKFKGLCGVFCHSKNSKNKRPQEDYRKDSTTAPCMGILCAGLASVPSSTSLSFSCVLKEGCRLPALAVAALGISSQVIDEKQDRHLGSKQLIEGAVGKTSRRPDITLSLSAEGHGSALSNWLRAPCSAYVKE